MAGRLAPPLFAKYAQGMADFVLEDMLVMEPEGLSQLDSQGLPAALESSSEWAEVHPGIRIKMRAVKVGGASVSRLPFINKEHNSKQPRHLDQEAGLPGGGVLQQGGLCCSSANQPIQHVLTGTSWMPGIAAASGMRCSCASASSCGS